jgi:hypothetical protein
MDFTEHVLELGRKREGCNLQEWMEFMLGGKNDSGKLSNAPTCLRWPLLWYLLLVLGVRAV